ncbi:MAG: Lon protease-like protein [Psychromonas sp.]|jgi:Lon protease-like protein
MMQDKLTLARLNTYFMRLVSVSRFYNIFCPESDQLELLSRIDSDIKESSMRLALFPLPVFLLPEGITRLRIFEPRYKRLVAESMSTGDGFGLCLPKDEHSLYEIGTRVEIYNFDQDINGFLTIDIKGIDRFTFKDISSDFDALLHADVTLLDGWEAVKMTPKYAFMQAPLKEVLTSQPLYVEGVKQPGFNNLSWICQRWLEVLPVPADKKYWLAGQSRLDPTIDFIREVIK